MPGVVEPTEKQTLSNVVILKLVYREQRAVCFFKDKQHRSLSKIFREREQGEGEKNVEKKGEQWGLTQWAEPEAAP